MTRSASVQVISLAFRNNNLIFRNAIICSLKLPRFLDNGDWNRRQQEHEAKLSMDLVEDPEISFLYQSLEIF